MNQANMTTTIFDKSHDEAFNDLGAQRPGYQWSAFDVPLEEAREGKASFLVTTIWNFHNEKDPQGRRDQTEIAICQDRTTGTYWYRMTNAVPGTSDAKHVAHMKRMDLAFKQRLPVVGILKDVDTGKCASSQLFDCPSTRESLNGKFTWLQLIPRNHLLCEKTEIDLDQLAKPIHESPGPDQPIPPKTPPEADWNEADLRASTVAYLDMARRLREGLPVVKKRVYRDLAAQIARSEKSCEYRMQNISYVLTLMGRDWIKGLPPAKNVGAHNAALIEALIGEVEGQAAPPRAGETLIVARIRKTLKERPEGSRTPGTTVSTTTGFIRDAKVKAWVLERAKATCEACDQPAPFSGADGFPFLEVHHLRKLADGGSDTVTNAAALCPNCHRRLHFSEDAHAYRETLYGKVAELVRE